MKFFSCAIVTLWFVYLVQQDLVIGQETSNPNDSNLNPDWNYCLEFTWLGPEYDNYTRYNGTCADYLDETRAKNVPCRPPIVITYNGNFPDIDYLWKNHKSSVLCRKTDNKVCARYIYKYNGEINNATYMCTKVMAIGESAVTSGCYTQTIDGYDIELCVCDRNTKYMPCNAFK